MNLKAVLASFFKCQHFLLKINRALYKSNFYNNFWKQRYLMCIICTQTQAVKARDLMASLKS